MEAENIQSRMEELIKVHHLAHLIKAGNTKIQKQTIPTVAIKNNRWKRLEMADFLDLKFKIQIKNKEIIDNG